MLIVTVLKTSTEYRPEHAQWLHSQLQGYDSVCMTDAVKIEGVRTLPLRYNWPSWFSKLNLFNPDDPNIGKEDIFYIDIDTVITGDLQPFFNQKRFTALTDFYREGELKAPMASGVMFIPAAAKRKVWDVWKRGPNAHMSVNRGLSRHGDQGFIGSVLSADRWQNETPGKIVSYKRDIAAPGMIGHHNKRSRGNGTVPPKAAIVCFHGNPRPWVVEASWIPQLKTPTLAGVQREYRSALTIPRLKSRG